MKHLTIGSWAICWAFLLAGAVLAEEQASPKSASQGENQPDIDFDRARALLRKARSGGKLTEAETEYLDRARAARRAQRGRRRADAGPEGGAESLDLVPLVDLSGETTYKGRTGGLYGDGRNEPPQEHLADAMAAASRIRPRDADGKPSPEGKVVLLSNGMSNTTQEFQAFLRLADSFEEKSPSLVIVDGAIGGMEASDWAHPEKRFRRERPSPWDVLDQRLERAGVSPQQVQVVWIKQARRNPASLGEFPKHADALREDLVVLLGKLKQRFPNLQLAYLSSRIYAGYARSRLNPEPYAYESAFAVRDVIQRQIEGDPRLNHDPGAGAVRAPVVAWGPYLWANGVEGREGDDLVWKAEDFARDGTHPSDSGRRKVGELLLEFFTTDPTAKPWFVESRGKE